MDLLVLGHAGAPVLVFPSSHGRFYDWENLGMAGAIADKLEQGHNQMICVDSVDGESFYNKSVHPYHRIQRHLAFEGYVMEEVVPFIQHRAHGMGITSTGASFGGYHAANFFFKFPWAFSKLISLSGAFDVSSFMHGYYSDAVFYSMPAHYVPGIHDPHVLHQLRQKRIILTAGEYDPCRSENDQLHYILNEKGIPHTYDFVHGAFGHDWPWWKEQLRRHIV